MKRTALLLTVVLSSALSAAQSFEDLPSYTVDEFYERIELDYGTLDETGYPIDYIFIKTDLDRGQYKIDLTDGPNDLYEIKGTDVFISFRGYFGYAGYGTECVLEVSSSYSATVYKLE